MRPEAPYGRYPAAIRHQLLSKQLYSLKQSVPEIWLCVFSHISGTEFFFDIEAKRQKGMPILCHKAIPPLYV